MPEVNRQLLQASLGTRDPVTLDIDATVIHAKKKTADRTYKGKRGFTPMVGHIAETGQVLHAELRKGNVSPSARNVEFFKHCIEALPEGVRVAKFRADAASYQAAVINLCREQGARFAIRARMSRNVRALIAEIPESEWQPVVDEDVSCLLKPSFSPNLASPRHVPDARMHGNPNVPTSVSGAAKANLQNQLLPTRPRRHNRTMTVTCSEIC